MNDILYKMCYEKLQLSEYSDMKITSIFSKKQRNTTTVIAYGVDESDPDRMVSLGIVNDELISIYQIPEWDFTVDEYYLDLLENNYQIDYCSLSEHYNIWHNIKENREEMSHEIGLQNYLNYCEENNITKERLNQLHMVPVDIMHFKKEQNQSYIILAETKCYPTSVVFGVNPKAPSPYVTWMKHEKEDGKEYNLGHYFTSINAARKDFDQRSKELMNEQTKAYASFTKEKKEVSHER